MLLRRLSVVAVLGALCAPALANAAISEFPAGGVVFKESADISIAREDLYLSVREVRVHYDYQSDATATQTVTMGFPMPPVPLDSDPNYLGGSAEGTASGESASPNYMSFAAKVNGEPVETVLHEFAFLDGVDVTAELEAAGLPAFLPHQAKADAFAALAQDAVEALEKRGLIPHD